MADPARKRLTYADLLEASAPDRPKPELIDGELFYKASPRGTHAWSQRRVGSVLDPTEHGGDGDPGWWILVEPDVVFSTTRVLRPDLAGWRRDRLSVLRAEPIDIRPDWVCEVLSPSHQRYDRQTKRNIYGEEGVPWYWLLDPDQRYLEVFQRQGDRWMLLGTWSTGEHVLPPFTLTIQVDRLFAPQAEEPPMAHERGAAYG